MTIAHLLFVIIIAYFVLSAVGIFFSVKHAPDAPNEDQQYCDELESRYEPRGELPKL